VLEVKLNGNERLGNLLNPDKTQGLLTALVRESEEGAQRPLLYPIGQDTPDGCVSPRPIVGQKLMMEVLEWIGKLSSL
jgi:hypothetical protein